MQTNQARWNTLRKLTGILALALLTTVATQVATAVDVYTDPVGFITLTAVAGPGNYTFQGLGMTQLPSARGNITAIASNALTVTGITAGQLNPVAGGPNPAYFVEILNGANPGLLDDVTGNDATTIYTASANAGNITGATNYKVYPHWTIGTVFGPQNQVGLFGGSSGSAADNILVWNSSSQGFATYYFKTSGIGGTGWRSTTSTSINTSNTVMYIDEGFEILRKTTGDVTNKLVGGVKLGTTICPVVGSGYTFVGNVYPATFTLGASGLYTTNSATGLNGGSSGSTADDVLIWNPATQGFATYYFKTSGIGGTGWRSTTSTSVDASGTTIPLGGFVTIQRRVAGSFNWNVQQPFVNP